MNNNIKTPVQYSEFGQLIKKFLHTKLGVYLGYKLGISGFNRVDITVNRGNGIIEKSHSYNARVNAGAALCASLISGTTLGGISSPQAAKYIAVSSNTLTPAAGDTTLSGELTTNGMARAAGTSAGYTAPASLDGAASYTLSYTFTATGTVSAVNSAAIFDASSSGNMLVEANFSTTQSLVSGNTMQVVWTVNL